MIKYLSLPELLVVIRETENDDLTSVLQELIETYSDNITDVTVDLCTTLVCLSVCLCVCVCVWRWVGGCVVWGVCMRERERASFSFALRMTHSVA